MAGVAEAQAEGERVGVEVIPGVEISLDCDRGTFHLIGLFVDPENVALAATLGDIRHGRKDRNRRLTERLAELGMPVDLDEVTAYAGGEVVARPHFARAMIERGYAADNQDAFDRFLAKGRPAYVERTRLGAEEALSLVRAAGGVSVLCHPFTLDLEEDALRRFVRETAALGLDAMEVRYSAPDRAREVQWRRIAEETGLLESGGSDFHGHTKKDKRLGLRAKTLEIPMSVADALRVRAEEHRREA